MKKKLLSVLLGAVALLMGFAFVACDETADNTSSACEHTYSVVEMEAKCTTDGQKISTCTKCGYVQTETLTALGHDLGEPEVTEATCNAPKTLVYQCKRPGCGGYEQKTEGKELGHDYQLKETISATCTDDEKGVYECSRCQLSKTEVKEDGEKARKHNHQVVESATTPATCTEAGGALYRCVNEGCNDEYTDVIPATGHTSDNVKADVTEPSCTEKGYTTRHCSVCNKDYQDTYTQPIDHKVVAGPSATASCSAMGYDSRVCSNVCNGVACNYIERSNFVANSAHKFGADGKCETCQKNATDAFALECGEKNMFLIEQYEGNLYKVYSKPYSEQKIVIPYAMVEKLVAEGVNMIVLHLGSKDTNGEARSLSIKVDGGETKMVNATANEVKQLVTIDIADENGNILPTISQNGITLAVYYRAMNYADAVTGASKVDSYAIRFYYTRVFDINDVTTWIDGDVPYTYDATKNVYDLTTLTMNKHYKFTIRPELIKYHNDNGAISVKVSFESKAGQRIYLWLNGAAKNISIALPEVTITEEVLLEGIAIDLLISDLYGTAWAPQYPADGCIMKVEFIEAFTAKSYVYSKTEGATVDYNADKNIYTVDGKKNGNLYTYAHNKWMGEEIKAGRTVMSVDIYSTDITWIQLIAPATSGAYPVSFAAHVSAISRFNVTGIAFTQTDTGEKINGAPLYKWSVTVDLANLPFTTDPVLVTNHVQYYDINAFANYPMQIVTTCTKMDIAISFSAPVANA